MLREYAACACTSFRNAHFDMHNANCPHVHAKANNPSTNQPETDPFHFPPAIVVELGRYLNTPPSDADANKYTTQDPIDLSIEERRYLQNPMQKNMHRCLVNLVPS